MKSFAMVAIAGLAAAQEPVAPVIDKNTPGAAYVATFDGKTGAGITGSVLITGNTNGTGTTVQVSLANIPDQSVGGPYLYHIHAHEVAANGSCATALAHLDPTNRGEKPACDASAPATCQVGDLAGKYGKITASSWSASYNDPFISNVQGNSAFYGDKSIVIHYANTTRIACANFKPVSGGSAGTAAPYPAATGSGSGSASGSAGPSKPTGSSAPITPVNGAASVGASLGAMAMAVAAFVL